MVPFLPLVLVLVLVLVLLIIIILLFLLVLVLVLFLVLVLVLVLVVFVVVVVVVVVVVLLLLSSSYSIFQFYKRTVIIFPRIIYPTRPYIKVNNREQNTSIVKFYCELTYPNPSNKDNTPGL